MTIIKKIINTNTNNYIVHNLNNKKNVIQLLPIVSTPIVAYAVDKKKIAKESEKLYRPYTRAVENSKQEFKKRGLKWDDDYADSYDGTLTISASSIIDNYDENKEKFEKAGLTFGNYLIDSSTGKLNIQGNRIWNKYEESLNKLQEINSSAKNGYINKKNWRNYRIWSKKSRFQRGRT